MSDKKLEWREVVLASLNAFESDVCPEHVMQEAINELRTRQNNRPLRGERQPPAPRRRLSETSLDYCRRYSGVNPDEVSHLIDVNSLRLVNGMLLGNFIPHGPHAEHAQQVTGNGLGQFGMRVSVRYKEGNTTQTQNRTVEWCDIITFDLVLNHN
jgi:hypothetical protein